MDPTSRIDPETGDFALPGVEPETFRPPSRAAVFLSASVMVASIAYAAVTLWTNGFHGVVIAVPVFAGGIVGALSSRRPLRNVTWTFAIVILACLVWAFSMGGYAMYVIFFLPLPVPGLLIGALCGHTLRRFVAARRQAAFVP